MMLGQVYYGSQKHLGFNMAGISYYIIDTETTGLKHDFHDLTEISVIRFEDRMQISRNVRALKPENANYDALQITGKTMKDLYTGMERAEMVEEVNYFMSADNLTPAHRCIVAHNAPFDRKFLHHIWDAHRKVFPADLWLDTLTLSRKIAKAKGIDKKENGDKQSFGLYAACDLFGIKKIGNAHNAKDDTRNTYLLLKQFIDSGFDFLDMIKRIPHGEE